ncbi:hypothetical protein J3E69DRAFT_349321 [Trichoderma sp. SZMC 28015]
MILSLEISSVFRPHVSLVIVVIIFNASPSLRLLDFYRPLLRLLISLSCHASIVITLLLVLAIFGSTHLLLLRS